MLQPVRGTKDIFGEEIDKFNYIVNTAKNIAKLHNFKEIITPIFEFSDVFERNLGDTSDVVSKEMYKFKDRSNNMLCLRPEFTAGVVRAVISNPELNNNFPAKFFSYGPVFRYDRPQKGRYRQFNQINLEYFGNSSYLADIDILQIINDILKNIGLKNITLEINSLGCKESRDKFETTLKDYFSKYKNDLSNDSKIRLEKNVLRILDSKEDCDKKLLLDTPTIDKFYTNEDKIFFNNILDKLSFLNINYVVNKNLVRGLDYYTSTVFEFTTNDLGAQSTVFAGGRYDNMLKQMSSIDTPAVGAGGGIERLMLLISNNIEYSRPISIVPISENEINYCLKLKNMLQQNNINTELVYSNNMKKKMNITNKIKSKFVIIVGEDEVKNNILTVKNLDNGEENKIDYQKLIEFIK